MVTSPLYDATRRVLNRTNVVGNLSMSLLEQRECGRILVKGTCAFRYDPYGPRVLESREYPTPVYPIRKPTTPVVLAPVPKRAEKPVAPAAPQPEKVELIAEKVDNVVALAPAAEKPKEKPVTKAAEKVAVPAPKPSDAPVCRALLEFKRGEDVYVAHMNVSIGDFVLVEGDRGQDMGKVIEILPSKGQSIARIVSVATPKEKEALIALRKEEAAAVKLCQQRVKEHGLKMKIEDVEFQYDGGKVTIYYSSNCAVDFRQLQRQLFRDFRCRVWLRTVPASS